MSSNSVAERFGIVSKVIFSERETNVRMDTGRELEVHDAVELNADQLRALGRQAYMLARRLDKRMEAK